MEIRLEMLRDMEIGAEYQGHVGVGMMSGALLGEGREVSVVGTRSVGIPVGGSASGGAYYNGVGMVRDYETEELLAQQENKSYFPERIGEWKAERDANRGFVTSASTKGQFSSAVAGNERQSGQFQHPNAHSGHEALAGFAKTVVKVNRRREEEDDGVGLGCGLRLWGRKKEGKHHS
jgi:hypothetical protein